MKQVQRQQLQQKLSPQQIQLMRLLQLPVTDLEQAIKEEIEKNPLLEAAPPENEKSFDTIDTSGNDSSDWDSTEEEFGYDYHEHLENDPNTERREFVLSDSQSFAEALHSQLSTLNLTHRQQLIAEELIGTLDDAGYLSRSLDLITNDLAFRQGVDATQEEVLEVLRIIQSLEPAGIGARNLQECLLLQLERKKSELRIPSSELTTAESIIKSHFDDFANHRYERVCAALGINQAQLDEAVALIRHLNPKPGSSDAESDLAAAVFTPDIILHQHDGELHFHLNDGNLPRLSLNTYYTDLLAEMEKQKLHSTSGDRETIQFLRTKQADAQGFIDLLQQRHDTIVRVMRYIIRHQYRFLLTGDTDLMQPMRQREVAEATGLDISTISRMANSKYIQTDFGTIPLKECFSKGMSNEAGEEISVETIKQRLSDAIAKEDKHSPLSDEALTKLLNNQGYPLARRTVAKYREQLGIPVARLRRVITLLFLLLSPLYFPFSPLAAQSYYDSLISVRIEAAQKKNTQLEKREQAKKTLPATTEKRHRSIQPQTPPDTLSPLSFHLSSSMVPLWYTGFPHNRVNPMGRTHIDLLPDEIVLKLVSDSNDFCFPVKRPKTSNYGWRWERGHHGVDIGLPIGEPVHCAFSGIVRVATHMGGYGNCIVVRHPNGLETLYGHLSKINVKPDQQVEVGEIIGLGGNTGNSTGPHLHFECRFLYQTFDPEWILDFTTYTLRTRRLHLDKSYFGIHQPRKGKVLEYKADNSIIKETKKGRKRNHSSTPAFNIKDF